MKKPTERQWLLRYMLNTKVGPLPAAAIEFCNPFMYATKQPKFTAPRSLAIVEKLKGENK
jgi:hypothetical protein